MSVNTTTGSASSPPATLRMINGTGGAVGITTDGRSAPIGTGEWLSYRFGLAPAGLATRRQLAAHGLRPGGAQPVAQLTWRHGRAQRVAYLYDLAVAVPKRAMTKAKAEALDKAMLARRTCPTCHHDAGYVIPRTLGECVPCHDGPATANRAPALSHAA
jgi:hypothetical protein